jgi:hypothetical protein
MRNQRLTELIVISRKQVGQLEDLASALETVLSISAGTSNERSYDTHLGP